MSNPSFHANRPAGGLPYADRSSDPGGLVPAQRQRRPATPELQLMAAVLAQALDDDRRGACDRRAVAQRLRRRTRAWFASRERDWPYSFERICAALDLDAEAIRERLASMATERPAAYRRVTGPRAGRGGSPAHAVPERRVA